MTAQNNRGYSVSQLSNQARGPRAKALTPMGGPQGTGSALSPKNNDFMSIEDPLTAYVAGAAYREASKTYSPMMIDNISTKE